MERPIIQRREAVALGLKRFFTGKPCHMGHVTERYVSSGGCLECVTFRTPAKHKPAVNLYWPARPVIFEMAPAPTEEEKEAAYNYMLANGWHYAALEAVRKDPAVLAAHVNVISVEDVARADALINKRNAQVAALQNRVRDEK